MAAAKSSRLRFEVTPSTSWKRNSLKHSPAKPKLGRWPQKRRRLTPKGPGLAGARFTKLPEGKTRRPRTECLISLLLRFLVTTANSENADFSMKGETR